MNYDQSVRYLLALGRELAAPQQAHVQKFGLENITTLASLLGQPHRARPCAHIAGTNGKGSTAAMVDSILRAAGMASAPAYIAPILNLLEAKPGLWPVLRREWVTYEDGDAPFMLSVTWCRPEASDVVPELLELAPLPDPAGAAKMIADRTGLDEPKGEYSVESRPPKDDGREGPLLRLPAGDWVLAVVATLTSGGDVIEYREEVIHGERVIGFEEP